MHKFRTRHAAGWLLFVLCMLALVPDAWLEPDADRPDAAAPANPAAARDAYRDTLLARLAAADHWLPAAGS